MRRVLIATPEKALVSRHYAQSLAEICGFFAAQRPDVELTFKFCSGTSVNFARNELAHDAIAGEFDDMVFIDSDMGKWGQQLLRLLDHDVPIVGGLYTSKTLTATPWLAPCPGERVREDGLLRSLKIATGFMRIKVKEVFPLLQTAYPESAYFQKQQGTEPPKVVHEFFPMGIVGPGSFENKIQAIRKALAVQTDMELILSEISDIVSTNLPGNLLGEDYYFCHRCVEAGIPIYADTKLMVPHFDMSTEYPPDPQKIIALAEKLKGQS